MWVHFPCSPGGTGGWGWGDKTKQSLVPLLSFFLFFFFLPPPQWFRQCSPLFGLLLNNYCVWKWPVLFSLVMQGDSSGMEKNQMENTSSYNYRVVKEVNVPYFYSQHTHTHLQIYTMQHHDIVVKWLLHAITAQRTPIKLLHSEP